MSNETVNKRLKIISDLKDEVNKLKAMKEDTLDEDPEIQEIQDAVKEVTSRLKERKNKVMATPANLEVEDHLKELNADIKDQRELLAIELADYYRETGKLEIVDNEGNTKRIVFSTKLVNP